MSSQIKKIVTDRLDEVLGKNGYRLICLAITGSNAYGMQRDSSDFDIMGIFLPNEDYIYGIKRVEQVKIPKTKVNKTDMEGTMFSFSSWFNLLINQNPNIIELLWHEENMYVYRDPLIWPMVVKNRSLFLSKRAARSFGAYTHAQFVRLDKISEKDNQNPARIEEFKKAGYGLKNASHLLRLLNMCLEILVEEQVFVMRPDRQLLIAVREGKYTLPELQKIVEEKNARIEDAYVGSKLRTNIDLVFANELCKKIHRLHLQFTMPLKWYEKLIVLISKLV